MDEKLQIHGHFNGLKTTLLFSLMWAVIMLIWYLTGASRSTLWMYILIGIATTFASYWFSDKIAIASMNAQEVSEEEAPELYKIVRELSGKAGKPMPRIYIAPTMSPNAFATGRNERHAAVCCTQGILQILNSREIRGVLGHELMHVYNHDILTSAIASAMATVISYLGYSLMYFGGSSRDDRENSSGGLGAIGFVLSMVLAPLAASLIQMAISRTREYDADEDGSKLTQDPEALASALEKITSGTSEFPMQKTAGTQSAAAMMISNPFGSEGFSKLFSTHPPTDQRIARLKQMASELGSNDSSGMSDEEANSMIQVNGSSSSNAQYQQIQQMQRAQQQYQQAQRAQQQTAQSNQPYSIHTSNRGYAAQQQAAQQANAAQQQVSQQTEATGQESLEQAAEELLGGLFGGGN